MKISVEKEKFVNFLKLVNFNGLVKDVLLVQEGDKKIKAEGICNSNALVFSLFLNCDKVETKNEGKIPIFDIAQLLLILERFGKIINLEFNGERIIIKEKKKQATIRCDSDVTIDSKSRMEAISIVGDVMEVKGQEEFYDFNKGISVKLLAEEIQDLTKNTSAINSSNYSFLFNKENLKVESNNSNDDNFTQEVEIKNVSGVIDESRFVFNYGLKEVFSNLEGLVSIKFLEHTGMMIRNKFGRIIISGQQG